MTPDFTTEELRMIFRLRHRDRRDMLGWVVMLLPLVAFAVYGMWHRDAAAVFVAWAGTTCWVAWWLAASGRSSTVLRGILDKYAAATATSPPERADRGAAG